MSNDETTLADLDTIVHEPDDEFVESTNVYDFMQTYGIDDYDELVEPTRPRLNSYAVFCLKKKN